MKKVQNVTASVRQRLLNLSRERGDDFQLVITQYALERFLYRLSVSQHKNDFVLKGAMLFGVWSDDRHRATRDLDLLGFGDPSPDRLRNVIETVCAIRTQEDGLQFDTGSLSVAHIREDKVYEGTRATFTAMLGRARIHVQVDVGFGDATTPPPEVIEFPTLLDFAAPKLRAYPRETVVAEKFEAMVTLGIDNSRMKDFYDIAVLAGEFEFDGQRLQDAVRETFLRRGTSVPNREPLPLTDEFYSNDHKETQWRAFVDKGQLMRKTDSLEGTIRLIRDFIMPVAKAVRSGESFAKVWVGDIGWH